MDNKELLCGPWSWEGAQNENAKQNTTTQLQHTVACMWNWGSVQNLIQDKFTSKGNLVIKTLVDVSLECWI